MSTTFDPPKRLLCAYYSKVILKLIRLYEQLDGIKKERIIFTSNRKRKATKIFPLENKERSKIIKTKKKKKQHATIKETPARVKRPFINDQRPSLLYN